MLYFEEVVASVRGLKEAELHLWMEARWVLPVAEGERYQFSDIDVARVRLLCELQHDLGIAADAVEVILPLIDQIHALERQMRALSEAIAAEPEEVRRSVLARLRVPDQPAN